MFALLQAHSIFNPLPLTQDQNADLIPLVQSIAG